MSVVERREWRRKDTGSALLLMPAAVLVVLVLGAIAVDAAVAFLGERELADLAAAAANDAAVSGLDARAYYGCGALRLDQSAVASAAAAVVASRTSDAVVVEGITATVTNTGRRPSVTVTATGSVALLFSPAVPGGADRRSVQARSTAVAEPLGPTAAGGEARTGSC